MEVETDHYEVLGLASGEEGSKLTEAEITKAYRLKALELHPDKNQNDTDARINFQRLTSSYEILKDEKARQLFDDLLRVRREHYQHQAQYNVDVSELASLVPAAAAAKAHEEEEIIANKLREEIARIRATRQEATAASTTMSVPLHEGLDGERILKVTWDRNEEDYSAQRLKELFAKFGQVEDVVIRLRNAEKMNASSALIVMASKEAAVFAMGTETAAPTEYASMAPLNQVEPDALKAGNLVGVGHHPKEDLILNKFTKVRLLSTDRKDEVPLLGADTEEENRGERSQVLHLKGNNEQLVDTTSTFTTDMEFFGQDGLVRWCQKVGRSIGVVVVVHKSDSPKSGRKPRVSLCCERSGEFKYHLKKRNPIPKRRCGTKKIGCPFMLKGILLPDGENWKVQVVNGNHNHPLTNKVCHSYVGRLNTEERKVARDMYKAGFKPRQILQVLKNDPENASTIENIYSYLSNKRMLELEDEHVNLVKDVDDRGVGGNNIQLSGGGMNELVDHPCVAVDGQEVVASSVPTSMVHESMPSHVGGDTIVMDGFSISSDHADLYGRLRNSYGALADASVKTAFHNMMMDSFLGKLVHISSAGISSISDDDLNQCSGLLACCLSYKFHVDWFSPKLERLKIMVREYHDLASVDHDISAFDEEINRFGAELEECKKRRDDARKTYEDLEAQVKDVQRKVDDAKSARESQLELMRVRAAHLSFSLFDD